MTTSVQGRFKRLPLAVAVVAALAITPVAFAQAGSASTPQSTTSDQTTTQTQTAAQKKAAQQKAAQQKAKQLQTVTVSGSLIQMPENESVSPVQTVDIQAKIATGSFGTADILMGTAIASGSTEINGQFGGFLVNGGTGVQSVNLRGLGPGRTLVLLNGQRPGPAGTRGQVGAFDLNVIPVSIIQRIDIVKDGSSSIYGSDAIAGVVNIITKQEISHPTINIRAGVPVHGGGEQYTVAFADGWNVSNGNFLVAAQWDRQSPIKVGQRPFLSCQRERLFDASTGQPVVIPDASVNAGTKFQGCGGMWYDGYINGSTGQQFVQSQDGHTGPLSLLPGFVLRHPPSAEHPYRVRKNYGAFLNSAYGIARRDRASLYAASNLNFGNIGWDTLLLYSYRRTQSDNWREFFPETVYPWVSGTPDAIQPNAQALIIPVDPYPMNSHVKVDYFYGATKVTGFLPGTQSWTWEANGTYSKSTGTYDLLSPNIDARLSGDLGEGTTGFGQPGSVVESPYPPINLYLPGFMNGSQMQKLVDVYSVNDVGRTTYTQETANVLFTGDLFDWWGGTAKAAFGGSFLHKEILDTPAEATLKGWTWGASSAGITSGSDNVKEAFGQVNLPLVQGVPGIQKLELDMSARGFHYNSVGSSSYVWRMGVNWQVFPTLRVRGTLGTSYKAPKLFELYLADETGFVSQLSIDPCIDWGSSTNVHTRTNCAAAGIPANYNGNNPTGTSHQGGGKGFLKPEVSRAKTIGIVWTPSFTNISLSLDYFDYKIRGEIEELGAGTIVAGCYTRAVYPNHFCDQLKRNPPTAALNPNMITDVFATYTNINMERTRGYDLFGRWHQQYSFGTLSADMDTVYTINDVTRLFAPSQSAGFTTSERIGYVGNPHTVVVAHMGWKRGNWSVMWQGRYFSSTRNKDAVTEFTLYNDGGPMVRADAYAKWQIRQDISITYSHPLWAMTFGVRNMFDRTPNLVSPSVVFANTYGNTPLSASQYDYFGRTLFMHLKYSFE